MGERSSPKIVVSEPEVFVADAADAVAALIVASIDTRGRCRLVLAGGNTPRPIYEALAKRSDIAWSNVEFLFGDERAVGPHDPASNYRMAREALFDRVGVTADSVARIEGERDAMEARETYDAVVATAPLDVVLLGMGGDGHTASLFPGDVPQGPEGSRVVVSQSPIAPTTRISLSMRAINDAAQVVMLVTGAGKATRLAEVLAQRDSAAPGFPAAAVRPAPGELTWLVDRPAAAELP